MFEGVILLQACRISRSPAMDGSFDCRLSRETSYEVLFKASVHRRMKVTHSWRNNFRDLVRALLEAAQHSMMNEWFSSRRKKVYSQCAAQVAAIIADAGKKDTNCPLHRHTERVNCSLVQYRPFCRGSACSCRMPDCPGLSTTPCDSFLCCH